MTQLHPPSLPPSCPFVIRRLGKDFYLIREHDDYAQYPHIYVKICRASSSDSSSPPATVIVLSDTGCGTTSRNANYTAEDHDGNNGDEIGAEPEVWNIRTVLEHTVNPGGRFPYLVITTHCHFDHIMGIGILDPSTTAEGDGRQTPSSTVTSTPTTTVASSSHDPAFITPYSHLSPHSHCPAYDLRAPNYSVGIWARDDEEIVYDQQNTHHDPSSPPSTFTIPTGITTLHTPGHTPDSLSWFCSATRLLCLGDSAYTATSASSAAAPWGPEPRSPIIFVAESDLADWWRSVARVLEFVGVENSRDRRRVGVCAAHVNAPDAVLDSSRIETGDAEVFLLAVRRFVGKVLNGQIKGRDVDGGKLGRGESWGVWDGRDQENEVREHGEGFDWMVQAPVRVVEEGRKRIPRREWERL